MAKFLFKDLYQAYIKYKFRKYSHECLSLVHNAIHESGAECWLEFGTLLGAIRANKVISHDIDLDFGLSPEGDINKFKKSLETRGFQKVRSIYLKSLELEVEFTYEFKGCRVDFFIPILGDDKRISYFDFLGEEGASWKETIEKIGGLYAFETNIKSFELVKWPFYDLEFDVPANHHEHLIELYGEDYNKPNPNWTLSSRTTRKQVEDIGLIR